MSGNASSSTVNVKTEILRLAETQEEKVSLLSLFSLREELQPAASSDLGNLDTDKDKLAYLRTYLRLFLSLTGFIETCGLTLVSVIFANNTEYLLILVLFFPASQTRPKNTFALS